jgi:hypothetical protein
MAKDQSLLIKGVVKRPQSGFLVLTVQLDNLIQVVQISSDESVEINDAVQVARFGVVGATQGKLRLDLISSLQRTATKESAQ